jgi:predicted ATPase
MSQEALAERTGLSVDAIGLLERGARRRPQRHTADVLAHSLALEGDERDRFLAAARAPAPLEERARIDRVPRSPSPILGRSRELQEIGKLLSAEVRLLTLTGPGGVGKTRLALAAAEQLRGVFAEGVVFVPLAPVADSSLVLSTIAQVLDVPEVGGKSHQESLEAVLSDRELLLVLDNFEHLTAVAPGIAALVAAAPCLRVLVTSRSPLRVRAEREFPVRPLPVPAVGDASDFAANPAIALYAARAHAALPQHSLTPTDVTAVGAICRRLDGLPLAIELAAGRAKILPPEAMLARLESGTAVLRRGQRDAPARHQSLAATLDWSHDLLEPAERAVFRRLAVFRGGWTLEAAETVCAGDGLPTESVLDGLAILADQSLVLPPVGGDAHPRFQMLETIREYAGEQLARAGDAEQVRARHAACFLVMAEAAAAQRRPASKGGGFARLDPEHDNLRAALGWAWEQGDARFGLRLAAALARFWFLRAHYAEGRGWLERFLAMDNRVDFASDDASTGPTRARALEGLAALVYNQGDYARAAALYEEGITRYREASDRPSLARALTGLGGVARDTGDRTRAVELLEESLALYRIERDPEGIAHTLANLGSVVSFEGDFERAEALLMESVMRYRDLGDETGLVFPMRFLALTHAERGRYEVAVEIANESLALSRAVGDRGGEGAALNLLGHLARDRGDLENAGTFLRASLCNTPLVPIGIAGSFEGLAGVEAGRGRAAKAALLLGAASKLRAATGDLPTSYMTRRVAADRAAVRSTLGAEAFGAAWDAGRRLSLEAALDEALRDDE